MIFYPLFTGIDIEYSLTECLVKRSTLIDQDPLINDMAKYILQSRADSTVTKYRHYFNNFKSFCDSKCLSSNPATYMTVALYITHMLKDEKSASIITSTYYSIKWMHSIHGYTDPTENTIVKNLLDTSKRLFSKPVMKKDVINSNMLHLLCKMYENNMTIMNTRDLAMILICYSGFLRFNELSSLYCSDIKFMTDYIVIRIRKSKTDIYREGKDVYISKGSSIACPYLMLQKYMSDTNLSTSFDQFLFRPIQNIRGKYALIKTNKQLSYTRAKECIVSKLKSVAPNLKLGTHSLRASGATTAANAAGINDRCLKRHGRWKSDLAKDGYIVDSLSKKLEISKCLGL